MTLNKIINVILLVAALYFGYTFVIPWFKSLGRARVQGRGLRHAGTGEEADCVIAAREAARGLRGRDAVLLQAADRRQRLGPHLPAHREPHRGADDKCDCSRPGLPAPRRERSAICASSATTSPTPRAATARRRSTRASSMSRIYDALDLAAQQSRGLHDG